MTPMSLSEVLHELVPSVILACRIRQNQAITLVKHSSQLRTENSSEGHGISKACSPVVIDKFSSHSEITLLR